MPKDLNRSSEIRDALASTLLDVLSKGAAVEDSEGNLVRVSPPASYLAVAKDYLKTFPPTDLPTAASPSGDLARFASQTGNGLPFSGISKGH